MIKTDPILDTLNNISIQKQASKRDVKPSSQSSIIKTAMAKLKRLPAIKTNKHLYDVIKDDKSSRHLKRHKAEWTIAVNIYQQIEDAEKQRKEQRKANRKILRQSNPKQNFSNMLEKQLAKPSFELKSCQIAATSINEAFELTKQLSASNSNLGAIIMYNTIVSHYTLTTK